MTLRSPDSPKSVSLQLLGTFGCTIDGLTLSLPAIPRAVLAHVALNSRSIDRKSLERILWPGLGEAAAAKRLRQVIWRVRAATDDRVIRVDDMTAALLPGVSVDWEAVVVEARRIIAAGVTQADRAEWDSFALPLLPEHACTAARAAQLQWNHLRFVALQRLAEEMLANGEPLRAVEFAAAGIRADPMSEWPYRVIAQAHSDRGDVGLAMSILSDYSELIKAHYDLRPSPTLRRQTANLEMRRAHAL